MRLTLEPHPATPSDAVAGIEVEVERPHASRLELRYIVSGAVEDLALPAPAAPNRADDLWQHSCFEAFLRAESGGAYQEFNFAPSTEWAAYAFTDYREGRTLPAVAPPKIEPSADGGRYELRVVLEWSEPARLGLSAVIEERSGRKSYWALAHPPGDPDFHHPDCFVLQLPPAD